jgi:hypothetical protein
MSRASQYAARYLEAVEVQRAAQRARDGVQKIQLILPARPTTDQNFGLPNSVRLIALINTEGSVMVVKNPLDADEALALAAWMVETCGEPSEPRHAREEDRWMKDLHRLDCAVWQRAEGTCTCGGLKFEKPSQGFGTPYDPARGQQ